MSGLAPSGGYQDDVVLLLYRHPAPLELKFPAHASHLAPARTALRSWLTRARVDPDQAMNVLIAAGEAVANAIEHGHRHSPEGTISLGATALVDQVQLTITDTGSWKPPQPAAEPRPRPGHHPHARAHARRHHQSRHRRNHSSPIREDHLMPTSLTLDTARRDDGKLVLIAAGEIDLSNIDAFDASPQPPPPPRPLAAARRSLSTSAQWSTWTAPPSTPCSPAPTTSISSPTHS